jgi:short subunit dehydrogenase-like uncharacterized protein
MAKEFLLYGSYGFVGDAITRLAVEKGLQPILAGRDGESLKVQAAEFGLDQRVVNLDDPGGLDSVLQDVTCVLHCAGPFKYTFEPMIESCLRTSTHYLDITGELSVYTSLAKLDEQAKIAGIMILPGVGFDVVATDCLALYLKRQLPSANQLRLAFQSHGPAKLPPGTAKTMLDSAPGGIMVRQNGELVRTSSPRVKRMIDFGRGDKEAIQFTWGDLVMAYHSTGIPNIEEYTALPKNLMKLLEYIDLITPLLRLSIVRKIAFHAIKKGSTQEEREASRTSVWGQVENERGQKVEARLHGSDAGVTWTAQAAVSVLSHVLGGDVRPGFQTPASAYGPDLVLECEGVRREDI